MPVYSLLGLTVLILVIAVYATVVEEVEDSSVDSTLEQDWETLTYDQQQEYRKAG